MFFRKLRRLGRQRVSVSHGPEYKGFPGGDVESSVARRFRKMATLHPKRIAVADVGSRITYSGLAASGERICSRLLELPVESNRKVVAVMMRHGAGMIAPLIGAAMAGRPYVFLDPLLPEEHLKFVIEDAEADCVITDSSLRERAIRLVGDSCSILLAEAIEKGPERGERVEIDPSAPFCVNYTSGTTGRPSGVVRSQRALLANIRNMTRIARISCDDRVSCLISPAFGAAAMDIFGALLNGACVVPYDVRENGTDRVPAWVQENGITLLHSVPSLFRAISRAADSRKRFRSVRFVLLGGEQVHASDLEAFKALFREGSVMQNVLGMTEGAGILCSFLADHKTELAQDTMPVGFPVAKKHVWVGDEAGKPLPPGQTGEIFVRSRVISEIGNGKITTPRGGNRMLPTGDLGYLRHEDGALVWVGRNDNRLKIAGIRVSPAEVEGALLRRGEVREAAVTAEQFGVPGDPGSGLRLIGWIVSEEGSNPDSGGLRQVLQDSLPPDAIPARFLFLDHMPRLPNGKIDRRSLLVSDHDAASSVSGETTAPRNDTERIVLSTFEGALGMKNLSVYDHFFEGGGDSLASINSLGSLSSHFGFEITSSDLIANPTAASLAEGIASGRLGGNRDRAVSEMMNLSVIRSTGTRPPVFILPGGGGGENELLAFVRLFMGAEFDRPVYGFRISGFLDEIRTMDSLAELAEKMAGIILETNPLKDWVLIGECGSGPLAAEVARWLEVNSAEDSPARLVLFDSRTNLYAKSRGVFNEARRQRHDSHIARDFFKINREWEEIPFETPVDLIASTTFADRDGDSSLGWNDVCRRAVEVHCVSGSHVDYIRQESAETLRILQEIFGEQLDRSTASGRDKIHPRRT